LARKILLADDSVTAQNMGRKILADAGYEVSTVNNGSAALKRVAETRPDVIVLDVYMPGYSGLEVCLRLKEASETARIPILLTVGKLEPFKPEEARRARADGFIVKPFEASELLSALSKLEDKIVPLPEPPKPGRFARAIAAVEEGRYDKEDIRRDKSAAADEDSGWKERISFPSKKKKKAVEPEDVDDPALYNPVNKDLRTVVERKPAPTPPPASPDDTRVDLGALSLQGLPQDVTPQEIAAIAAAAARMTGTFAANEGTESPAPESRAAEVPPDRASEPAPQPPVATPESAKVEERLETKPELELAETLKEASAPVTEMVAEQKAEKKENENEKENEKEKEKEEVKVEAPAEKPSEPAPEPRSGLAYPSSPDLTGAIVALPLGTYVSLSSGSGTASGNGSSANVPESEPVTMAAAAGAEIAAAPSRWMAVPVTLAPEEAAISLELEMQKAHAAFAAAEAAHAAPAPPVPEAAIALVEPAPATEISVPVETAAAEPVVPFDAPPVPNLVQSMGAVASQAAEAIRAAVKEFENVAASYVKDKISPPKEPEPAPDATAQAAAQPAPEVPAPVEAKVEPIPVVEEKAPELEAPRQQEAPQPVLQAQTEEKKEEPQPAAEPAAVAAVEPVAIVPAAELSSSPEVAKVLAPVVSEVPAERVSASQDSAQITEASAPAEPAAGGNEDMAKKEKEIADSTAAAWASWRRIRESDAKGRPSQTEEEAPPKEEAAMAAAAGAETAPEEVPAEGESDEIASIVDSVLADMRPKIVQEISKKLGKKKK